MLKQLIAQIVTVAVLISVTSTSLVVSKVLAAVLTLQEIGASSVGGASISSWTYMGTNPTFVGTADPSATVTLVIGEETATATADSAGAWSYTPTTLVVDGSFPVTITSGDATISFTLALSPSSDSVTATDSALSKGGVTEELPLSGGLEDTLKLVAVGLGLIAMGFTVRWLSKEHARVSS